MDIEDGRATILEKTKKAEEQAESVQLGLIVSLKIWQESQNPEQSITGSYLVGNRQLDSQIQKIILHMKVGDQWKISSTNKINQSKETINVFVASVRKPQASQNGARNCTGANSRAQQLKKQGNNFIKQKKYKEAITCYQNCYDFVQYSCDQEGVDIRLSIASNLALATLNLSRFRQCLEWCSRYISQAIQPNKKVVYRQISAYKGLKEWNTAKQNINKALQLFKNDSEAVSDFKTLKQNIEKQQKVEFAKEKKIYANMFG